jgi:hydrogenase maturation factor
MCITRVGKVLMVSKEGATVAFFDGARSDGVDVSVAGAEEGSFVEVYGNLALSVLTEKEARSRKAAWQTVRRSMLKATP